MENGGGRGVYEGEQGGMKGGGDFLEGKVGVCGGGSVVAG